MSPACTRCRAAIDDFTALDRSAQRAMSDHAASCAECGSLLERARKVNAFVRGLPPVAPPVGLMPRLLAAPHMTPPPRFAWPRFVPFVLILAVLGVVALREREVAPLSTARPQRETSRVLAEPATPVARRLAVGLATVAPPGDAAMSVSAPPPRSSYRRAAAPAAAPTDMAAPPTALATLAPAVPSTDAPGPAPSATDEPTSRACGTIVVRVFTDLAGADGAPCAGCDGRLTDDDVALAQALGLRLPMFQLSLRAESDASRLPLFEGPIEEAGQVVSQTFDIPCDLSGPVAVSIGADLGAWQPCAASAGVRQVVPGQGAQSVDFPLTTTCAAPTASVTVTGMAPPDPGTPGAPLEAPSGTTPTPPPAGQPPDPGTDLP